MVIIRRIVGGILLVAALVNSQFDLIQVPGFVEIIAGFGGFGLLVYGTGKPNAVNGG